MKIRYYVASTPNQLLLANSLSAKHFKCMVSLDLDDIADMGSLVF
jgi:hypothetical protein